MTAESGSEFRESEQSRDEGSGFERWRARIGLVLGPALFLLILLLPAPSLTPAGHRLTAILVWVVVWWVGEPVPIPVSALLGATLCVLLDVAPAPVVLAPFADPLIFLFLGSFLLAEAMTVHGLDRQIAYRLVALPGVGDHTARILFVFGAATAFLSMWISNTAAAAMMFPIGLGVVRTVETATTGPGRTGRGCSRFATAMMLMTAYGASVGGIGTPIGTPPNLIGLAMIEKFTAVKIPFFRWLIFALPLLSLMYLLLYLVLVLLHPAEVGRIPGGHQFLRRELEKLGRCSPGARMTLLAFLITIALWIAPGVLALFVGTGSPAYLTFNRLVPEAVAALLGAALLFVLPVDWRKRSFTLTWQQALRIDWGTLLLFGGGLALGNLMFKTGLAETLGSKLLAASGAHSLWGITLAAIVIAVLVSEAASNTAAANMVVPVAISLALAARVNPLPPAIGAILGSSWGFMLPVSTPPNAIVYSSHLVPLGRMIRTGIVFDLLGALFIWLGLRLLLPLAGLA